MSKNNLVVSKYIAHRGASSIAPENTLAALKKAHQLGAKWVEFDVMLTSDEIPIIFHDDYLDRTTNYQGKVSETPYSEIEKLDAGSWFAEEYQGEKIPTLADWLECAAELGMGINLEMKVPGKRPAKVLAELVLLHLERYWDDSLPKPLISSFYKPCLQALRDMAPEYQLGLLLNKWTSNWQRMVSHYQCVSLHLNHKLINAKRVALIKELDLKILAYTVDHPKRAEQLFALGVDGIFSNNLLGLRIED